MGAVLRALERHYHRLLAPEGRAAMVAEFERRSSFTRGRRVSVEDDTGRLTGTTEGLDAAGYLLLRRDDTGAVEPVFSGRIRPAD